MGKDIRSFFGVSNGASQGSKRQEAPEESSEESGKRKRKGRLQDVEPVDELDSGKKESSKNKKVSMSRAKKSTGGVSKKNTKKSAYFLDESNSDDGDVPYQPKYTALAKRKQRSVESDEDEDDSLVKNQAARKFTKKQAISVEEDEDFIDTTKSNGDGTLDSFFNESDLAQHSKQTHQSKTESKQKTISPSEFFGTKTVNISSSTKSNSIGSNKNTAIDLDLEDIDESFFDDLPDVEIIASSSNHLSVNPKNDISNIGTPKRDNSAIPRENAPVKLEESPDISPKMSSTTTQNISKSEPKSGKKWFPGKSEDAPKNLGLKELPVGLPMCLEDKRFVLTGTLDSITRETAQDLIQEYGGRVTGSVSSRTSFLVTGETPGESKLSKAKSLGVRIIDEDGLFDLIRSSKPKKSVSTSVSKKPIKSTQSCPSPVPSKREIKTEAVNPRTDLHGEELWVDQFKPSKFSDIIGNGTLVSKLVEFIENFNPDPSRRNSKELAVLISGPPGIGKTTTATLIAKLSGYETVEFNASDARNQTSVRDIISTVVGNRGIAEFSKKLPASHKSKIILIMDEVDGMSTGDRGGMQELIKVIKNSRIPIICICNDRSNPKVRSLSNYCLDLRFRRPTKQQIAKKLQPLIVNKGLNFDLPAFEKLVESCHSDIRQVINTAQFWSTQRSNLNYQNVKQMMEQSSKDIDLGPFDVAKEFFFRVQSGENRWIDKRLNYYFVDPSLVPLMVYDLYPSTQTPLKIELSTLEAISKASDSIIDSDLVDQQLRMNQAFSLMPLHGMLSCVLPGAYVSSFGGRGQIFFPAWLGKNSTRSKNSRLLAEAKSHMSKRVSGNNLSIQLDYLPVLRATILQMLSSSGKDAVSGVIELLDEYGLTLEDFETTLFNSASLSGRPIQKIDSKIKAAITREYKKHHDLTVSKGKKTAKAAESMLVEEDDDNLAFEGEFVKTAEDNDESNPEESDSDISGLQKKSSGVAKSSSGRGGKSSSKTAKGTTSQAGRKTSSKKK